MKKSISIILACAIGAGLGTMLAINFGAFWILGLIIGSLAGYLVYDLPTVIMAIPKAWKYATENYENIKRETKEVLMFIGFLCAPLLTLVPITIYAVNILSHPNFPLVVALFTYIASLILLLTSIGYRQSVDYHLDFKDYKNSFIIIFWAKNNLLIFWAIVLFSPVVVYLLLSFNILRYISIFIFKITPQFLWKFFKIIHSDLRLLVGVDSLIGGAIGLYFGNILIGMFAGAILGFVNYYFVSLKILKLKPEH